MTMAGIGGGGQIQTNSQHSHSLLGQREIQQIIKINAIVGKLHLFKYKYACNVIQPHSLSVYLGVIQYANVSMYLVLIWPG